MRVRPAHPDDAPAVVALRARVYPHLVRGVPSTRQMLAEPPPDSHWAAFVAEVRGEVVGRVSAYRNAGTVPVGEISLLHVHPEHRGHGIGSALLTAALRHLAPLGLPLLRGRALPESLPYARRWGFVPSRDERFSALDLRSLPPLPAAPAGVRLVSLVGVDPRLVYHLEQAAGVDEPGDVPADAGTYEQWRADVWDDVGLDRAASTGVEVDGVLAAISLVKRDGTRMWSDYTATLPEHRGRGLATAAKLAALHRAAATGVTVAYTGNDEANAPMLAVNARLGCRPVASQWSCLRELP